MCNAKHKFLAAIAAAALLASCGSNEETTGTTPAQDLLAQAEMLVQNNPDSAMTLIDSLCRTYKSELETVRQAIELNKDAIIRQSEKGIVWADSVIAVNEPIVNELKGKFVTLKPKDVVEPYQIYAPIAKQELVNITTIQPRIDQLGKPYLLDLLHGVSAKHTCLVAKCGGEEARTAEVPLDKATNYRFSDAGTPNEMITFHPENCEDFFRFVASNRDKDIKVTFAGGKAHTITLSKQNRDAIATTWIYAAACAELRVAQGRKIYCTERAKIAQKQKAGASTSANSD